MRNTLFILCFGLILSMSGSMQSAFAQDAGGPPPARVVVSGAENGSIAPTSRFVGTLYFVDVSNVASETSGKVEQVHFNEGEHVERGQALVRLSTDILEQQILSRKAQLEEALTELEKSKLDLQRMTRLHNSGTISDEEYETVLYRVRGLENNISSIRADVESLELQRRKKTIRSPFDGVVLEKLVVTGEWVEPGGSAVAVLARAFMMEAIFNLPQEVFPHLSVGDQIDVATPNGTFPGTIQPFILRGDVNTRTIPVKIRFHTEKLLAEGMAVQADFPVAAPRQVVLVPRDALISFQGRTVVFVVNEQTASPVDVEVVGYTGDWAGLRPGSVEAGMTVVTKGNERLRPGQTVQPMQAAAPAASS